MCEDDARPSRRHVLSAAAGAAAAGVFGRRGPFFAPQPAERDVAANGAAAYSMAMHVHSSFSEQNGSMDSQLFQAAVNAVDVLWWTDHDARMDGIGYRKNVHFTSLTAERGGPGQRGSWHWTKVEAGSLAGVSGGGIVSVPYSPNDPVAHGSLRVAAKSRTGALASYGYYADSHPAGWNYRDNLTGQSLIIDVLLEPGWRRGYLELLIATSYHEAAGGRAPGVYTLSYRFVPAGTAPAGRSRAGIHGAVTIPVTPAGHGNPWATITIRPAKDIAALWPDLDYRDFGLWKLTLSAVSDGELVGGYFDYLRFDRRRSGEIFLSQQADMGARLALRYPAVTQRPGLEVSMALPHLNWFGGAISVPGYQGVTDATYVQYLRHALIPQIHAVGGLISYNHPYGYADPPMLPRAQQDARLRRVARALLPAPGGGMPAALGADLLEVGYPRRQGVDLGHHVALWDILSRNAAFLTGNGTSDDHFGQDWAGIHNNWITSTWAASKRERDLLASLAAGRAWCGSLSRFRGSLDMLVDGSVPMGSVSVSRVRSRHLAVSATQLPRGGSLQVLRGAVDYAGTADLAANTGVIAAYGAAKLAGGPVRLAIDTGHSCFVRTQVLDASGAVVGLSNPVWLLRRTPPGGIPPARAA